MNALKSHMNAVALLLTSCGSWQVPSPLRLEEHMSEASASPGFKAKAKEAIQSRAFCIPQVECSGFKMFLIESRARAGDEKLG
jgi:hypothetical protein